MAAYLGVFFFLFFSIFDEIKKKVNMSNFWKQFKNNGIIERQPGKVVQKPRRPTKILLVHYNGDNKSATASQIVEILMQPQALQFQGLLLAECYISEGYLQ